MREIRFRAWIKPYTDDRFYIMGKMVGVEIIDFGGQFIFYTGSNDAVDFNNIELMQFTGLKDKNGVEIYEGDVVAFTDDSLKLGVIKYKDCRFMINWEEDCFFSGEIPIFADRFDVLGNIYENPELLGV